MGAVGMARWKAVTSTLYLLLVVIFGLYGWGIEYGQTTERLLLYGWINPWKKVKEYHSNLLMRVQA
jgi:hypothetical protein